MSGLRYLGAEHLDQLQLGPAEVVDRLESVFRDKAAGGTLNPPKIFFHREGDRFYSAMASCSPSLGLAGNKWQSGDPENPARGLPYIQGLYLLNDDTTGEMLAVMDAAWITGIRTAAASALAARYLARPESSELALLGCGLQGRAHLRAMTLELPELSLCRAFDIVAERREAFVAEMSARHPGVEVVGVGSAEAAVRGADLVISGGPIQQRRQATLAPDWVKPGALIVTIDYDSYVTDACIDAMDAVYTDDREQLEDAREREGKFLGVGRIDGELAEVVDRGEKRRANDPRRLLVFNLGIALEDLATAAVLYRRAVDRGIGVVLGEGAREG